MELSVSNLQRFYTKTHFGPKQFQQQIYQTNYVANRAVGGICRLEYGCGDGHSQNNCDTDDQEGEGAAAKENGATTDETVMSVSSAPLTCSSLDEEKKQLQHQADFCLAHYQSRPPSHPPYLHLGQQQYVLQSDTVFVLGMPLTLTKNDIAIFFEKYGQIAKDLMRNKYKIFVYKNKVTGFSKGQATITYVSPYAAQSAITNLNGSKFLGHTLTVLPAYMSTRKGCGMRFTYPREAEELQSRRRKLKWKPASDNWNCVICHNSNFAWRSSCNRCKAAKTESSAEANTLAVQNRWRPRINDWTCDFCFNINYWHRKKCNRCTAPRMDETNVCETKKGTDKWELVLTKQNATD